MQIRCNIDTKSYSEKPPRIEAGAISNRTRQQSGQIVLTPEELICWIKQGYTFTPAAIGGNIDEWKPYTDVIDEKTGQTNRKRKALINPQTGIEFCTSDFWESQQIIIADIDNEQNDKPIQYELTPAAALQACKDAGINPYCIYKTFNNTDKHNKFRVLIVLEEPITDFNQAYDYIDRFSYLFDAAIAETYKAQGKEPETCADSSIEPVKFIYGGRPDCIYYQSSELTTIAKLEALPQRPAKAPESASKEKAQKDLQKTYKANAGHAEAQTEAEEIIEALEAIDPALLSDNEWFKVLCALKHEGFDYSIADAWSARETGTNEKGQSRYNEAENYKRWQSIGGKEKQANKLTIFKFAYSQGWQPSKWQKNAGLSSEEWAEMMQSFDNMPGKQTAQEIHEQDYPAGFFDPEVSIAFDESAENVEQDAEQTQDASMLPAMDPTPAEAYNPENMTPPPASNKAPAPAPEKKLLQLMSAAHYLSRNNTDASQYDADIEELKQYAGRKMGLHDNIDRYLTLFPGLAVLGGQASLGKTTFAINMIAKLLERNEHVLFFTLEQRTEEIITKTVSQYIYSKNPDTRLTNLDLGRGSRVVEIEEALAELPGMLQNFNVIECDFETTAADIENIVDIYMKSNAGIKPIVIVDYLQLIAPPEDVRCGDKERIDYNLKAMKRLQKNNGLFMLLISSFNRSSNLEPISYESFFGTSMIEFTCDYVFGLQLQIQDADNMEFYKRSKSVETSSFERKQMIHKAQQETPKEVQFVSIKNRRGKQFFTANFNYYPANDYFEADYTTAHPYNNMFDKIKEAGKSNGVQQAMKELTLKEAMQAAKEQQE